MPIPKIIVFTSNPVEEEETQIIKNFTNYGFLPHVDSVHTESVSWFKHNYASVAHRFYFIHNEKAFQFIADDLVEETPFCPQFSISFPEDEEVGIQDWFHIMQWVDYYITNCGHVRTIDYLHVQAAKDFLEIPIVSTMQAASPTTPTVTNDYQFRMDVDAEGDTAYYEIIKPNTDLPYTSVTHQFSKKEHYPFFSSLFISDSWGVSSADITFLSKIWTHLNMLGDFDADHLYRERVEACHRGEEPEPKVYRRSLEETRETVRRSLYTKRKRDVPLDLFKKMRS